MTSTLDTKRLAELGESEYVELQSLYCRMRDLKQVIDGMHDGLVGQGTPPDFDGVEAAWLMMDEMYGDLERYLYAECDPSSACNPVERGMEDDVVCSSRGG